MSCSFLRIDADSAGSGHLNHFTVDGSKYKCILQNYYVEIHELEQTHTHTQKFSFKRSQNLTPYSIGMNFNFIHIVTSIHGIQCMVHTHKIHSMHLVSLRNSYFDCISIAICSLEIEWNRIEFKMFPPINMYVFLRECGVSKAIASNWCGHSFHQLLECIYIWIGVW